MQIQSFTSLIQAIKEHQMITNQTGMDMVYGGLNVVGSLTPDGEQVVIALPDEEKSILLSNIDSSLPIEISDTIH
ncbi:MAG: hypothetical protein ACTS9Y_00935 [Methylophilus sp.]|uniref:hypothetical protein n=1 Tax=Methylophilus sp. TaxID=29541 RepID=UPI003FA185B2